MNSVFCGGLIYEFTEEPNHYGLVRVLPNENVQLLPDFRNAKRQLGNLKSATHKIELSADSKAPQCAEKYDNLLVSKSLPPSPGSELI